MKDKKVLPRELGKLLKNSSKSILLLGPRQTGKSTLIKLLKPELFINLANEREFLRYNSDPDHLESLLRETKPKTVFIDEIQRIPTLLNTLQDIMDNWSPAPKFYLSGSSARKLKRGQANLIPGRLFFYEMAGFCAKEFEYDLDLKKALSFGFLPENYLNRSSEETMKNLDMYAANYLAEEIKSEALTRNIQGFSRFLYECAARAGQVLDYSKLSSQAKVSRTSSLRFFEILEDTLIAQRISSFDIDGVATIKHPKFYFFDVGVLNGLLNNFIASSDRVGMLFEHLVYNQIRNSSLAKDKKVQIQFLRTKHGTEVDFIIQIEKRKIALEVKTGQVSLQDLQSLFWLKERDPSITDFYVVSLKEERRRRHKDILICDLCYFLKQIGL